MKQKSTKINTKKKAFPKGRLCVGTVGFEPTTPWSQTKCANRTALCPEYLTDEDEWKRGGGGIRTPGTVSSTTV